MDPCEPWVFGKGNNDESSSSAGRAKNQTKQQQQSPKLLHFSQDWQNTLSLPVYISLSRTAPGMRKAPSINEGDDEVLRPFCKASEVFLMSIIKQ